MLEWQAKRLGFYDIGEQEPHDNGAMMCLSLFEKEWVLESCCVVVSYAFQQSGLNPWYWSGNYLPDVTELNEWTYEQASEHSYGLFQFNPCTVYINPINETRYSEWYSPNFIDQKGTPLDGESQMRYFSEYDLLPWVDTERDKYYDAFQKISVDIDTFYSITLDEFTVGATSESKIPLRALVGAWMLKHEQLPVDEAVKTYADRVSDAEYWFDYYTKHPPNPAPVKKKKKMPLYMMMWWY